VRREKKKEVFRTFIAAGGMKSTRQRELILDFFLSSPRHMSVDELYQKLRDRYPTIGYATVCRTLKLFAQSGIAHEIRFGNKQTRYEHLAAGEHHDHLICTSCGTIVEFENRTIEELQADVAGSHGFHIQSHNLELYGLCAKCRK
jgi:Fur family transcriptional regulator, ferric uptake regulator